MAIKMTSLCIVMVGIAVGLFFLFKSNCETTKYPEGQVYWCYNGYTCTQDFSKTEEGPLSNCNQTEFAKYKTLLNPANYNNRIFPPFSKIVTKYLMIDVGGDP